METSLSFGQWLQQRRKAFDLTQAALARQINCSLPTLKKIEANTLRPSRELTALLLVALDVPVEERPALLNWARGVLGAAPPLATEAPPALVLRHQLRPPAADFVGRECEVEQLLTYLRTARQPGRGAIVGGVRGMGGLGKTELAYQVAHQLLETFPDAQIVLNLQGSSATPLSAQQALQAVIRTFNPQAPMPDDLDELLRHYQTVLHSQRVLILADDARDAAQVRWLMPPPGSALLVTSRQRFSLPGMLTLDLEQLREADSIRLLGTLCPRLDEAAARVIAHACGRLPLALRICGGILHNDPALEVAAYLAQLADDRERLTQLRDPDEPEFNVEASLGLSYARLDEAAQQVFRQLGVMVSDFNTALALAVVEAPAGCNIEVVLRQLLRWNLLLYDDARARWRLHDLVRDLARRYLEEAGELEAIQWRYARAAIQLAQGRWPLVL